MAGEPFDPETGDLYFLRQLFATQGKTPPDSI